MSSKEKTFSKEHVLAYADACLRIAENMPSVKEGQGFDTLLIPSRGAVPFFLGTAHALKMLGEIGPEHKTLYQNLGIPSSLVPLMEEGDYRPHGKGATNVLVLPFTADYGFENFRPGVSSEAFARKSRRYWTNVAASFMLAEKEKKFDPYLPSYSIVLREIEKREREATELKAFPRVSRMAMIDTAVTGTAIETILGSFDEISEERKNKDVKPYSFLVVGNSGAKLSQQASAKLNRQRLGQEVEIHYVPEIFSENRGVVLEGSASTVYPSIMYLSDYLEMIGNKPFFVGAGSWRPVTDIIGGSNPYVDGFRTFINLVYKAIDAKVCMDYGDGGKEIDDFDFARREFNENTPAGIAGEPYSPENFRFMKMNPRYKVERIYETGSRVMHVVLDNPSSGRIAEQLARLPHIGCANKKTPINGLANYFSSLLA